jgi:hypothetical protein
MLSPDLGGGMIVHAVFPDARPLPACRQRVELHAKEVAMKTRFSLAGMLAALTLVLVGGASSVGGASGTAGVAGPEIRRDIVDLVDNQVTPNGRSVSTASANGHTIELSGTGDAEPAVDDAAGGGKWVHRRADGSLVGRGTYKAVDFRAWQRFSGSFKGTPIADLIGDREDASSGRLRMGIIMRSGGAGGEVVARGILTIDCHLPGAPADAPEEGVLLVVRPVGGGEINFDQKSPDNGPTLFHVIP